MAAIDDAITAVDNSLAALNADPEVMAFHRQGQKPGDVPVEYQFATQDDALNYIRAVSPTRYWREQVEDQKRDPQDVKDELLDAGVTEAWFKRKGL